MLISYRSKAIVLCKLCQMNTTICDELPWYKIGKLFLHTRKEKHSNGLENRPSFYQVDKEAL